LHLLLKGFELLYRETLEVAALIQCIESDQAIGIPIRQRAQEHGIDDAEDGCIGADAQRQHGDRHAGKQTLSKEHPGAEGQIS
jgi:hypothetical protein